MRMGRFSTHDCTSAQVNLLLVSLTCMVIAYRRGSGGQGFMGGAGETELQLQRRRFAP